MMSSKNSNKKSKITRAVGLALEGFSNLLISPYSVTVAGEILQTIAHLSNKHKEEENTL